MRPSSGALSATHAHALPHDCPAKPKTAYGFQKPVPWLLGRQLLAGMKWIALASAYGDKLDHKDWMQASVEDGFEPGPDGAFWFDYIADSGDGQLPTYNVAYVALNDLCTPNPVPGEQVIFGKADSSATPLPRGAFLFVGGDTAYHIADYATLAQRFWAPFWWAVNETTGDLSQRPLFAVPGNHDYYDALHGFNRQFRQALGRVGTNSPFDSHMPPKPLDIPAFERRQNASYTALSLPFGWWFWGLDTQEGRLDFRQQHFFETVMARYCNGSPPDRLIVATPEPTTVCGRLPQPNHQVVKTFHSLALEQPLLANGTAHTPFSVKPAPLPKNKVRLDISGDTHHYERYMAPSPGKQPPTNYASVVAGMGGAFLHPSHTDFGEVKPDVLYPDKARSRAVTARQLFNPYAIFRGGFIWLFAAVVALIVTFATIVPTTLAMFEIARSWLPPSDGIRFGALAPSDPMVKTFAHPLLSEAAPVLLPHVVGLGLILLFTAIALGAPPLLIWKRYPNHMSPQKAAKRFALFHLPSVALLLAAAGLLVWLPRAQYAKAGPYYQSFLILGSIILLLVALGWGSAYSGALFDRAKRREIRTWEYWPAWLITACGIFNVGYVHWCYGEQALVVVAFNAAFTLCVFIGLVVPILAAVMVGAEGQAWQAKVGFFFIGLWHGLLQLLSPVLLIAFAPAVNVAVAAGALVLAGPVGYQLAARNCRWSLLVLWLIVGSFVIGCALIGAEPHPLTVLRLVAVIVLGAVLGCTWFGWYLAVTSLFNGHNNEVGGAARVAQFKQIVRIKLTPDSLTAYVIGFDEPQVEAKNLNLRLIDVFELRPS